MKFTRISVRSDQMGGVPCIRGLRIPVATVVGMVADGMADEDILRAFPDLTDEDIREALGYADSPWAGHTSNAVRSSTMRLAEGCPNDPQTSNRPS